MMLYDAARMVPIVEHLGRLGIQLTDAECTWLAEHLEYAGRAFLNDRPGMTVRDAQRLAKRLRKALGNVEALRATLGTPAAMTHAAKVEKDLADLPFILCERVERTRWKEAQGAFFVLVAEYRGWLSELGSDGRQVRIRRQSSAKRGTHFEIWMRMIADIWKAHGLPVDASRRFVEFVRLCYPPLDRPAPVWNAGRRTTRPRPLAQRTVIDWVRGRGERVRHVEERKL